MIIFRIKFSTPQTEPAAVIVIARREDHTAAAVKKGTEETFGPLTLGPSARLGQVAGHDDQTVRILPGRSRRLERRQGGVGNVIHVQVRQEQHAA